MMLDIASQVICGTIPTDEAGFNFIADADYEIIVRKVTKIKKK